MREIISSVAASRETMHKFDASGRQLTRHTHQTGLRGEFAFGELVGLYPDTSLRRRGDNGVDFVVPLLMNVDVKTRKARPGGLAETFLLVEESKADADIYVLAILSQDESSCECVGWIMQREAVSYPVGDLGTGVRNHQIPALDLLPMSSLVSRVAKWRRD